MKRSGFSLVEVLVSMMITGILLGVIASVAMMVIDHYDSASSITQRNADAQAGLDVIRTDLLSRDRAFPVTFISGNLERGWSLTKAGFAEVEYGSEFPAERGKDLPSDRLSFFIRLSEQEAERYDGRSLAYVVYFTSFIKTTGAPSMQPDFLAEGAGYSATLFRALIPPDTLFEKMAQRDEVTGEVPVLIDEVLEVSEVSVVATHIARFQVELSCAIEEEEGVRRAVVPALEGVPSAPSVLELMRRPTDEGVVLHDVKVLLEVCSPLVAPRLSVFEWKYPNENIRREFTEQVLIFNLE